MINRPIPWEQRDISPKDFESIILYLAKMEMPDKKFELYLKNGYKQYGIDIKGFDFNTAKNICIQCKYRDMDIAKLEKAINEFKKGIFYRNTSKFIIATISDLQKGKTKHYIDELQTTLMKEDGIELEHWDRNDIEEKLKNCYPIVAKHFGTTTADQHCFHSKRHLPVPYKEVEGYIERRVFKIENHNKEESYGYYWGVRSLIALKDLFLSDLSLTHKICLVSDAYQGKSTLLKQLAYELSNNEVRLIPILIEIKLYTNKLVKTILDENYSYWKNYPNKELVIILDGLDEISKDRFEDFKKDILNFSDLYPTVSIVFSCRKLFYSHYRIHENNSGIDFFELFPIQDNEVADFIKNSLSDRQGKTFRAYILKQNLLTFLYHPFYLKNLVELYKNHTVSKDKLPQDRESVIKHIIDESFKPSSKRPLIDGNQLAHEKGTYVLCIKRLALASQILGVNSIEHETVEKLFTRNERELLLHSSILTGTNQSWTFNIAFFQENLAALALRDIPYQTIIDIITTGKIYKKLKKKWIQTIGSFISLLNANDSRRNDIITFIKNDNSELLTICESSKFSVDFRIDVIDTIINDCINRNSFPLIIHEDQIVNFVCDDEKGLAYFLSRIKDESPYHIKLLCWRVIYYSNDLLSLKSKFKDVIFDSLYSVSKSSDAALLIDILRKFKIADNSHIDELIAHAFNSQIDFRNRVYQLLIEYNLIDKYYSFGIDGMSLYYPNHNAPYAAEKNIEKFLLGAKEPENINILFKKICNGWQPMDEHYSSRMEEREALLNSLCQMACRAHESIPSIFYYIASIVKDKLKKHNDKEYQILFNFFKTTNTALIFLKICVADFNNAEMLQAARILTKDGIEYLFREYEDGFLEQSVLIDLYRGLRYYSKDQVLISLFEEYIVANLGDNQFRWEEQEDKYHLQDIQKRANDIKYIQSSMAFADGVRIFFKACGKKILHLKDAYIGISASSERRKSDSNFISHFLHQIDPNNKGVSLRDSLATVKDEKLFNYFRANEILTYRIQDDNTRDIFVSFIEQYYYTEISKFNFTNSVYDPFGRILAEIYAKHQFPTDENLVVKMLWQMTDGLFHLKRHETDDKKKKLGEIIIENVKNKELLVNTILENMRFGIVDNSVLMSHLELCRFLKIEDARDIILELIRTNRFKGYDPVYLVQVYLEIGAVKNPLLDIFHNINDFNSYLYIELAGVLKDEYPAEISKSLIATLNNNEVGDERKLECAGCLISIGDQIGFSYLIKSISENNGLPEYFRESNVGKVQTSFALDEIDKSIKHILDESIHPTSGVMKNPKFAVREFILDSLYNLAKKGEDDLKLTREYLIATQKRFADHPKSKEFLFHADRILEKFRDTDTEVPDIESIMSILAHVKM